MEKTYWLGRKRAAMAMARAAGGSEARLIHYELAGRYSIRAAQCLPFAAPRKAPAPAEPVPLHLSAGVSGLPDALYFARLAAGADYLAAQAPDAAERDEHLAMARRYRSRARASAPAGTRH